MSTLQELKRREWEVVLGGARRFCRGREIGEAADASALCPQGKLPWDLRVFSKVGLCPFQAFLWTMCLESR